MASANLHRSHSLSLSDLDLGLGGKYHIAADGGDDDDGHDVHGDDDDGYDLREKFICPYCAEHYDVIGLSFHIDEKHPLDAIRGVCPLCSERVGVDLVGHLTNEHGNFLKIKSIKWLRKGGSNSTSRKELQDGALQPLFGGLSRIASSEYEPDHLLSSFIFTQAGAGEPLSAQPCPFEAIQEKESSQEEFSERKPEPLPLLDKGQTENDQRSEFVRGLLMSTLLDDNL